MRLENIIASVLDKCGSSGKTFSYDSIFASLFFSYLCGGKCLEDINTLVEDFRRKPNTMLLCADTVGRGLKELSEEDIVYKSVASGRSYRFNAAERLKNSLLLSLCK